MDFGSSAAAARGAPVRAGMSISGRWLSAIAVTIALAGCGGGGGGGDGGGSGGGGNPPPVGGSLIPAAPTPGPVLHADAATLRPLTPGAQWRYRGQRTVPGSAAQDYSSETTVSATGAALTESTTNAGNNGADAHPIALEGGRIVVTERFAITGKGEGETIRLTQLRSPVRVDDQWTVLEQRFTDTAIDADGDGKPDAIDVAIYARVIGEERLTLPRLGAVTAVRVDTRVMTRIVPSTTGRPTDAVTLEIQDWYAAGIGLVQERLREPQATNPASIVETVETLVGYDLVTTGDGLAFSREARVPATAQAMAGQPLPSAGSILGAAEFADHVLLFQQPGGGASGPVLASRLDRHGRVIDTLQHANLALDVSTRIPLLAHAGGAVLIGSESGSLPWQVRFARFDAQGALLGKGQVIDLRAVGDGSPAISLGAPYAAATDGRAVWLMWIRQTVGNGPRIEELVVRGFDMNGVPTTPVLVLDDREPALGSMRLALSGGRLVASWLGNRAPRGYSQQVATVDLASLVVTQATIATDLGGGGSTTALFSQPTGATLAWIRALGSDRSLAGVGMLRLSSDFTPLLGTPGTIDAELVPGLSPANDLSALAGRGPRLFQVGLALAPKWLDRRSDEVLMLKLSWVDAGETALSRSTARSIDMLVDAAVQPVKLMPLSDRVLGFTGDRLTTTVIWLPKDAR